MGSREGGGGGREGGGGGGREGGRGGGGGGGEGEAEAEAEEWVIQGKLFLSRFCVSCLPLSLLSQG